MFIAAGIPGARFVALDGQNHHILETDPGWPKFRDEIGRFLAEERPLSAATAKSGKA
jgi:hypothetical protein